MAIVACIGSEGTVTKKIVFQLLAYSLVPAQVVSAECRCVCE